MVEEIDGRKIMLDELGKNLLEHEKENGDLANMLSSMKQ